MISEYFYDPNKKHSEEQKIEFSTNRIKDLKDYIYSYLFHHIEPLKAPEGTSIPISIISDQNSFKASLNKNENLVWTVISNKNFYDSSKDRFYINQKYFEKFTTEWSQKTKTKLEYIDWCYLIMQVVRTRTEDNPGYNVSWCDSTMAICMELPPICE